MARPAVSRPHGPTITIRDVAVAAQVSLGTVSHVLNHPQRVTAGTLQRVEEAIERLGFVRNAGAALLRGGKARSIGLVLLDTTNPFFVELAQGVESSAFGRGQLVFLCNSGEDVARERLYMRALAEQRVPGVIISPADHDTRAINALRERETAIVLLSSPRANFCTIGVSDERGGFLAAEHLLRLGHRQLVYVTHTDELQQYRDRLSGMRSAVATQPDAEILHLHDDDDVGGTRRVIDRAAVNVDGRPTAVLCANDRSALTMVRALAAAGLSVPEQVSVVGYDDIVAAQASDPPLTTIRQPAFALGSRAMDLLQSEIDDLEHGHEHIVIEPKLIPRGSTAPPERLK